MKGFGGVFEGVVGRDIVEKGEGGWGLCKHVWRVGSC